MKRRTFSAYGLQVRSPFELPNIDPSANGSPQPYDHPDLFLKLVDDAEIGARWSDANGAPPWQTMFPSHCHVRLERGQAGDHLLTFGRKASFHLDAEGHTLLCAPAAPENLEWQRYLLDTALYCVSLLRGFEGLHASAVVIGDRVAALVASAGGGKSTLAAELVGRGHSLFADDVLALSRSDGKILAHPGPPLMSLPAGDPAIEGIGKPIDLSIAGETSWVRVDRATGETLPLGAVFILDRRPGAIQPLRETAPGRLLPHMLSLDRKPARALARFSLLRELIGSVPVYRVCAHCDLPEMAALVEEEATGAGTHEVASGDMRHARAA